MKRYFLEYNRKKVHVTEWSNNDKPVIFCLHGLGSTSFSFLHIAERLKEDFHIIAIDAPGHGRTEELASAEEYEMPRLADWVYGLIQQLKIGKFFFLTHSWGSFVGLHFLAKYPNNVIDTLLIDGGYQTKRIWATSMEDEMDDLEKDFDEYVFESWDDFYRSEKENYLTWTLAIEMAVKDLGVERNNRIHWHARGETARHIIRGMHLNETENIYHLLPKNITLLVATLPEHLLKKRLDTAEVFIQNASGHVILVEDSTHMLHWDRPEVVVDEIKSRWLTKIGG
ncbi:alpha/beta hydrolase [Fictibacillus nanhaiensis]|uniref:alpha/beta fold hydrolase n=1 Tax=Fictibacillus nanhaiensis TaxID=742169 RepID=UPI001C9810D2|nr:alpha/beta hydrolase [Fictibacillus nanhaiensis]MBY6037664.1 alpha/beta hydrolase [Fictibacillus nanhaiensis]